MRGALPCLQSVHISIATLATLWGSFQSIHTNVIHTEQWLLAKIIFCYCKSCLYATIVYKYTQYQEGVSYGLACGRCWVMIGCCVSRSNPWMNLSLCWHVPQWIKWGGNTWLPPTIQSFCWWRKQSTWWQKHSNQRTMISIQSDSWLCVMSSNQNAIITITIQFRFCLQHLICTLGS